MSIVVLGLSHKTSPVELRERFAFSDAVVPDALRELRDSGLVTEAVLLSTCNRVELYAVTTGVPGSMISKLRDFLLRHRGVTGAASEHWYAHEEPESLCHLFRVACGLDSMVLGETEILGQLKKAYDLALQHRYTGGRLNRAFQRAFNVAKHVRTETNIQRGSISVGSVAVDLAEKIFESVKDRDVMVVGAGDTSEKTARALMSRGARSLIVANRSYDRAVVLAEQLAGRAVHWDHWNVEAERVDIIISSTAAPRHIIDRVRLEPLMRLRRNRPLLLIDIAVPRDIDPDVHFLENVYLYNIDHLQAIADDCLKQRLDEVERCETIIRDKVRALTQARFQAPGSGLASSEPAFGHD